MKENVYNNLQRYAKIINRMDYETEEGYEMLKVYFYEEQFYMVKMVNGNVEFVRPIQYTDYKVVGTDVVNKTCCICGKEFIGYGNNPAPVKEKGRCCDECNATVVIPKRIEQWRYEKEMGIGE